MSGLEIAALVSAIGNVALGLWGMFKKKDLKSVSSGLAIVEQAIEDNKGSLRKTKAGRVVTDTIKEYGPVAREAVSLARKIANQHYEARVTAEATAAHEKWVRERAE